MTKDDVDAFVVDMKMLASIQKAFNQGRSYNHQDPSHGEWSHGDTDNNDPNGQPFQ